MRRINEGGKLGIGDVGRIHIEGGDADEMGRAFFGPCGRVVGAHRKFTAGDVDHSGELRVGWGSRGGTAFF